MDWTAIRRRYLESWWMPSALMLVLVGGWVPLRAWFGPGNLSTTWEFLILGNFVLMLAAAVNHFMRRRAGAGWLALGLALAAAVGTALTAGLVVLQASFGGESDPFGKGIEIPPGMQVEDPAPASWDSRCDPLDPLAAGLKTALEKGGGDSRVEVDGRVLERFNGTDRAMLIRHLASSSRWFLREERGRLIATRRFTCGDRPIDSRGGYYTGREFGLGDTYYQVQVKIGPDGLEADRSPGERVVRPGAGEVSLTPVVSSSYAEGKASTLIVDSPAVDLEIHEDTTGPARPFSRLALQALEAELTALLASPAAREKGFDPALPGPGSMGRGAPRIWLSAGMQGGIYNVHAYVNPGREGTAFLKVFEATRNIRLSEERLTPASRERVGWSDDPGQTFYYSSEVTVYEGDWEDYYPARFELWHEPADGSAPVKLLEKIFRIEGWQR